MPMVSSMNIFCLRSRKDMVCKGDPSGFVDCK
jgi:hypothetical protein